MRAHFVAALLLTTPAIAQPAAPAAAENTFQFLDNHEIQQRISTPQNGRVFGTAVVTDHHEKNYYVEFVKRFDHGNQVEVHPEWIDQVLVTAGEGVLTYGGRVINGTDTGHGEVRGESQVGAQTRKLAPGDYVVIPTNLPHKFDAARGKSLTYVIFKVHS